MTASTRRCVSTAALVVLALASTLPARAQTPDDIYAAAKSEGAFVLYVGGPTAPWEATARIFEQRYPGIKVAITGGFSNVLDKKIDQQIKDGKLEVDTAIFQTLQDFVRWKAEGQLLPYKPPGFDVIDQSFKDAEGAFYGVMVNACPTCTTPSTSPRLRCRIQRWIFSNRSSRAGWSRPTRPTTTRPCGCSTRSC